MLGRRWHSTFARRLSTSTTVCGIASSGATSARTRRTKRRTTCAPPSACARHPLSVRAAPTRRARAHRPEYDLFYDGRYTSTRGRRQSCYSRRASLSSPAAAADSQASRSNLLGWENRHGSARDVLRTSERACAQMHGPPGRVATHRTCSNLVSLTKANQNPDRSAAESARVRPYCHSTRPRVLALSLVR